MAGSPRSPAVPEALLCEGFRRAVLAFLAKEGAISGELRTKMLGWRHVGGFSAHNRVRVAAEDRERRIKLAGTMIRAPIVNGGLNPRKYGGVFFPGPKYASPRI